MRKPAVLPTKLNGIKDMLRPACACAGTGGMVLAAALSVIAGLVPVTGLAQQSGAVNAQTRARGATHPMDALSVGEIAQTVKLIIGAGYADETARFPTIQLKELPKSEVMAWQTGQPFERHAQVVMRTKRRTFEIAVNLTKGQVSKPIERPGAQPGIILDDWLVAQSLTMKDPRWLAAMKKRGFEDTKNLTCSPLSPGYFANDPYGDRRVLKVPCYEHNTGTSHLYGRPVSGVFAIVDVEEKQVLDVIDTGIIPLPQQPEPRRADRSALKPVQMTSAQGRNYTINGTLQIAWDKWSFHMRMERRVGPILSLVKYDDRGKQRLIAYQMSLSEMFVPYMDPGADWSYRTYLDTGEFGAGFLMSSLMAGSDCPADAGYVTMVVPNDTGRAFPVRRAACIFERNTASPLWRHGNPARPTNLTRPQVELVVRMIPTLGNYDYIVDWVFTQQGNIDIRVGAAGIVAVKNVRSASMDDGTALADTEHGTLVAPGTVALYHDHFFNFRLDLDVDGTDNTLVRDSVVPKRLPRSNPRRSLWVIESAAVESEGAPQNRGHDGTWRMVNTNHKTPLGHHPGVEIVVGHQAVSTLAKDDDPQRRAEFSAQTLWLTRQKPDELYAAGTYPSQSRGGDGLPDYVSDQDNVVNQDLVVWFTVGFHHITRVEDWPIMPVMWHGFTLRPFNFFDENPVYHIPAGFAQASSEAPALRESID